MASIEIGTVTSTEIEVKINDIANYYDDRYIVWKLDGSPKDEQSITDGKTSSDWYVFDNLEPGTSYSIEAQIYTFIPGLGDSMIDSCEDTISTLEGEGEDPVWSVGSGTIGTLSATYEDIWGVESYELLRLKVQFTNNGIATFSSYNASGVYGFLSKSQYFDEVYGEPEDILEWDYSRTGNFSFEYNVSSGTIYYLFIRHYDEYSDGNIGIIIEPPGSVSSNRPDYFEWDNPKVKGQPFNITAEEWGNLLDNINAVREYKGYSKIETTTTPNIGIVKFYYPSPGEPFYAKSYNQCLYAFQKDIELLTMDEYAEHAVESGDPITADAINFLVETINSVE